jgi:hypothetical protein
VRLGVYPRLVGLSIAGVINYRSRCIKILYRSQNKKHFVWEKTFR